MANVESQHCLLSPQVMPELEGEGLQFWIKHILTFLLIDIYLVFTVCPILQKDCIKNVIAPLVRVSLLQALYLCQV